MTTPVGALLVSIVLLAFVHESLTVRIPRPRGAPVSLATLYPADSENFTCFDGLKTIVFSQINDDYCDCADGSDEPGTSACANGKFHCTNIGHRSKNIPSSRVNDGICDCCDTSDEYLANNKCINTCSELGQEEQKQRKSMEALFANGAALRAELIQKGNQLKMQRMSRLNEIKQQKAERDLMRAEKEKLKKEAETIEAEALEMYKEQQREEEVARKAEEEPNSDMLEIHQSFLKYDTNKDSFIEVTELQVDISLDKDRDGIVSIEEAKYFLDERDRVDLEAFISLSWPRIKPYMMLDQGIFKPPAVETEAKIDDEEVLSEQELLSTQTDKTDSEDQKSTDFETEDVYDDEEEAEGEGSIVEETIIKPEYDPETQRIIELANEARNAFSEIDSEIRDIENEIKTIEEQDSKDYGINEEYASLDGECYTYDDREYVYKLCPFDRASQQQRSGGSETTLGRWDQWHGEADNKYSEMKYSHGASCWNGPQRSAIVQLKCAMENKVVSVSEPNRCEYLIVFETPANCKDLSDGDVEPLHDEL